MSARDWTMQLIADALTVSKKTISKDLADSVVTPGNNSRPKGGRPKKARKATPDLEQEIERRVEAGESVTRDVLADRAVIRGDAPRQRLSSFPR